MRALGAFYMRMTGSSLDCYKYLEPLLNDYRKIRIQNKMGGMYLVCEFKYIYIYISEVCTVPYARVDLNIYWRNVHCACVV